MKKAWRVRVRVLTVHHERGGECPGRVCSDRLPLPMGHVRSLQSPSPLLTLTRVPGPSSAPDPRSAAAALGFRPKHVTQDMVRPARPRDHRSPPPGRPDPHHVPRHPVRQHPLRPLAHRQRRAHLEQDSRARVPRAGTSPLFFWTRSQPLQPPPAYFTLYPRPDGLANAQRRSPQTPVSSVTTDRHPSLIERYQLAQKVDASDQAPADVGGKAKWEDTPDKREASLRERKAQMVLAARQRMLAQQPGDESRFALP
jgi:coupling of ubiquitin conjugation to ER degradation protein 1